MSTVCIFSHCFPRNTSIVLFYSCLISISPTQEFLELLFQFFAFFYEYTLNNTLKLFVKKCDKSITFTYKNLELVYENEHQNSVFLL